MKCGIFIFAIGGLLILGGVAMAQVDANRLCLHNGAEYYSNNGWMPHTSVNDGAGRYFPSFIHWASKEGPSGDYDWKIRGYAWTGMQGPAGWGTDWTWGKMLQFSVDNPYSTTMTFPYPIQYYLGGEPHSGSPWVVYGGTMTKLPAPFDYKDWSFPSSMGGFTSYINVFEYAATTWNIASTLPWYGWEFAFTYETSGMAYLPSQYSIYQYTFENFGNNGQYQLLSGNEMDCTGLLGGNKGKSYSLGSVGDTSWFYYENNSCTGSENEWAMCLFVEDAVSYPVNYPGATNSSNPYAPEGFDVGVATLMPNLTSTEWSFRILHEDYDSAGDTYIILGSIPTLGTQPWKKPGYRLPGKFSGDPIAQLLYKVRTVFQGTVNAGFTACMFGTTVGGLGGPLPFPFYDPLAAGLEIRWWGFNVSAMQPGAGFMTTFF